MQTPTTVLIAAALVRQRRSAEAARLLHRSGYTCEEAVHITRAAARTGQPITGSSSTDSGTDSGTAWADTQPTELQPMQPQPVGTPEQQQQQPAGTTSTVTTTATHQTTEQEAA